MMSVRCPPAAARTAVAAATVVLPTPPLPVNRRTRIRPSLARGAEGDEPSLAELDPALEPLERIPDDALLALRPDEPGQQDAEVDREPVDHLGLLVVDLGEQVLARDVRDRAPGLGRDPRHPTVSRRVAVRQRVARASEHRHVDLERHLGAEPALPAFEHRGRLHVGPLGVGLEVREHVHDLDGRRLDDDLALGLLAHGSLPRGPALARPARFSSPRIPAMLTGSDDQATASRSQPASCSAGRVQSYQASTLALPARPIDSARPGSPSNDATASATWSTFEPSTS